MSDKQSMSKSDASRIQSSQDHGKKDMSSSGFAARAQSAGDKNDNSNDNSKNDNDHSKGGQFMSGDAADKTSTSSPAPAQDKGKGKGK